MTKCKSFYSSVGDLWARAGRCEYAELCYEHAIGYWRQDAALAWRHEDSITLLQRKLEKDQSAKSA